MIRIITRDQLREKKERFSDSMFGTTSGERVTLVEVGEGEFYDQSHIKGAIQLPIARIGQVARNLLPDLGVQIVLYGEDEKDPAVMDAARMLSSLGYVELFVYPGGKNEWGSSSQWTESSLVPADKMAA